MSNPAVRDLYPTTLYDAYLEQIDALEMGGADVILIETVFDTLNAKAAIDATMEVSRRREHTLPIMLSVTVSDLAGPHVERSDSRCRHGKCEQLPVAVDRTELFVRS